MKDSKTVSFIIPVYKKTPETFKRCLESLFDQSYKKIEIICVFDGNDDELVSVANKFKVKTKIIEHGGACKARNAGVELATGDYLSFWDADCFAKPDMVKVWIDTFNTYPEADFVYSGYEFEGGGGFDSDPFDPYLLTCNNYIASMFPLKREKFPGWDESLNAAQDWDYWLTVVENGGKGFYNEGYAFITEKPTADSISGKYWSNEKYKETKGAVKAKHNIPNRPIVVSSYGHKLKGLHIAKLIGADFIQQASFKPHDYRMVFNLGFGPDIRFLNSPKDCIKVQYWMPWDIDAAEVNPYKTVNLTIRNAIKDVTHHLCGEITTQKRLADLGLEDGKGIQAKILPLPSEVDETESVLPNQFRVLLDIAESFHPIFKTIKQDMPYIDFEEMEGIKPISRYSLLISFNNHPGIDEYCRRFLINGRHIISNVQAPYCGYVSTEQGVEKFRDEIISKIREARESPFNKVAQDYYKSEVDPERFRNVIRDLMKVNLEVVA